MSDFSLTFQNYSNCRIAVYGLSVETEKLLPQLDNMFQVIGLLDSYKEEGDLYGKPIISMDQAIKTGVKMILVVARPGSCRVIARRIGDRCIANGIAVMNVRGQNLCELQKTVYDLKSVGGFTKNQLLQKTLDVDVVSFDLFDTLVMRQTLFPTDIYELVDARLRKKGVHIENFCGKRMESEKFLSQMKAPTLVEIYTYMADSYMIWDIFPEVLAKIEWEVELELVVPRQEMCEFFNAVKELGKDIYIVSDTYYTKQQITQLLDMCGICEYKDILASCEYQTSKTQRLFQHLKDMLSGKTCLHIGDDLDADVEAAQKNGIEACRICSGIELLEWTGYLGFWNHLENLQNRIKTGMFVAKLFNSPFQFESKDKKLFVKNAYDIGYLFFAPMISDFVLWFDQQINKDHIQNIWFCSRDGYLIKKMYDELREDTSSTYFLISRTAAIRAGMETEEDISYVEEMKFSGSLKTQLEKRFGIYSGMGKPGEKLNDYAQEILVKAVTDRKNYKIYIDQLNVQSGDIAFFDFVAKGTSQMFIRRLVKNHLKGYYFLRLEENNMQERHLDIRSFYRKEELERSAIFDNYYILETILTSPMPSIEGFDKSGKVIYAEETRNKEDLRCFQNTQKGICQYFSTYLRICESVDMIIDQKMDEIFLDLIHKVDILDEDFLNLTVEDPFFNRMSDIKDLI